MLVKVFVLGRPGSGKTTAIHHLTEIARQHNYAALGIDDYAILQRMSHEKRYQTGFRATAYDGFDVLDPSIYDVALTLLEQQVQQERTHQQDGIITIEFARNDYRHALQCFSPAFLADAYFLFVKADLTTCIQRIHQRVLNTQQANNHFVSDFIMQTYYHKDNWSTTQKYLVRDYAVHKEVLTLRNTSTLTRLLSSVEAFAERLLKAEFPVQPTLQEPGETPLTTEPPTTYNARLIKEEALPLLPQLALI